MSGSYLEARQACTLKNAVSQLFREAILFVGEVAPIKQYRYTCDFPVTSRWRVFTRRQLSSAHNA